MKPSFNGKLTQDDFPAPGQPWAARTVFNFSQLFAQVSQILSGGATLNDNMNGAKLTLSLAHGVPYLLASPLKSKQIPIGIQPLSCDTQATPTVSMTTSATVNGVLTAAPAGMVWLTALYPVPITDWVSYTPTGSWNTNTTYTGKWRRVGDTMEGQIALLLSGAPNAVTLALVNLPSSFSIDTSKLTGTLGSVANIVGDGLMVSNALGYYRLYIIYNSATSLNPTYMQAFGNNSNITSTVPAVFKSGDFIDLWFRVPIVGWGISSVTANVTLFAWGG